MEILHDHVCPLGDQTTKEVPPSGHLEVKGNPLLVRVQIEKQAALLRVRDIPWERPHLAGWITHSRTLHLNDICPHQREKARTIRPRNSMTEIEHIQATEETLGHCVTSYPNAVPGTAAAPAQEPPSCR